MGYIPKEHEETFEVKPLGVKYICEVCGKGEMKFDKDNNGIIFNNPLIPHICDNCGFKMMLPKVYPYIEWIPIKGEITFNTKGETKMKAMLSQPMNGKTDEEIVATREREP